MATARTWTIKGVSDRTREDVLEVSLATGLTVGEWVDRVLARAAEEARNPKPTAATREEVAGIVGRALDERLQPIARELERLAQAVAAASEPPGVGADDSGADPVAAVVWRLRRRRPLLHPASGRGTTGDDRAARRRGDPPGAG